MGAMIDEEALISAVLRVRSTGAATSAADCHTALLDEFEGLTLSAVKNSSKAAKRSGGLPSSVPAPASEAPAVVAEAKLSEGKQRKLRKQAETELKQVEN